MSGYEQNHVSTRDENNPSTCLETLTCTDTLDEFFELAALIKRG